MRLILFVVFFYVFVELAGQLSAVAGIVLDLSSFIAGLVVAALTAFTAFRVEGWMSSATRPSRPQSVKMNTTETPRQITLAAIGALFKLIAVTLAVIAFFVVSHIISLP